MARWASSRSVGCVAIVLAGCSQQQLAGFLPGGPGVTNHTERVTGLWVTSWIVLLAVGVITWGLIIWAAVVYRRRKGQTGLPVQLRYNLPIEIFYTIVPLILVLGFFAFTARDQAAIEANPGNPDVKIEVFGKRWSWDFNYLDEKVYSPGVQVQDRLNNDGSVDLSKLPTLYLPVEQEGADRHRVARRRPLLLGHRLPLQEGHDPGADQLHVLHPREDRHLPGQVRRALRRVPRRHALPGEGRLAGRLRAHIQDLKDLGQTGPPRPRVQHEHATCRATPATEPEG